MVTLQPRSMFETRFHDVSAVCQKTYFTELLAVALPLLLSCKSTLQKHCFSSILSPCVEIADRFLFLLAPYVNAVQWEKKMLVHATEVYKKV